MVGQLAADGKAILVSSHILTELAEMCDTVGIIEQGQLLATGSVEEILHTASHDSPTQETTEKRLSEVRMRVLGDYEPVARWLAQQPQVSEIRTFRTELRCSVAGSRETEADLLRDLVQAGFRVLEFGNRSQSLEHAFLHVTKGRVQ
jgi:ABC-2 type transport system ATP-binding protein